MRRAIGWITFVILAAFAGPGAAAPAEPSTPAGVEPAAGPGLSRDVNLSPAEYGETGQKIVSRLEAAGTTIRTQLQTARAQRDVVKTLCLNDKLNQIDVTIRNARERRQSLEAAMTRGDQEQGGHELTLLTTLRQRGDQISADAYACLGGDPGTIEAGEVKPFIDPNLPEDASEYPVNNVIVDPPACSSCIK
jgi:hypothetical protein